MSGAIHIVLVVTIASSDHSAWSQLMQEMVDATRSEPGTVIYQWYVSEKDSVCHIQERYADQAACDAHVDGFIANFGERFLTLATAVEVTVYGDPSARVREVLSGLTPRYFALTAGFDRFNET